MELFRFSSEMFQKMSELFGDDVGESHKVVTLMLENLWKDAR